jgi:hypothetical protein
MRKGSRRKISSVNDGNWVRQSCLACYNAMAMFAPLSRLLVKVATYGLTCARMSSRVPCSTLTARRCIAT